MMRPTSLKGLLKAIALMVALGIARHASVSALPSAEPAAPSASSQMSPVTKRVVRSQAEVNLVPGSLDNVRVRPNPWRANRHTGVNITFDGLVPGSTVKIFDIAGHWVTTLSATGTSLGWNRKNDRGQLVASGLYLFLINANDGQKAQGKLTIIR